MLTKRTNPTKKRRKKKEEKDLNKKIEKEAKANFFFREMVFVN